MTLNTKGLNEYDKKKSLLTYLIDQKKDVPVIFETWLKKTKKQDFSELFTVLQACFKEQQGIAIIIKNYLQIIKQNFKQ